MTLHLKKIFDPRYFLIFLIVLATIGVAVAGYVAQAVQYDHLFGLYQQQNTQLRQNGIKPITPSPGEVAKQGAAGIAGAAGADGSTGPRGAQGAPGVDGTNGVLGGNGAAGAAGTMGLPGKNGADGAAGAAGSPGADGLAGLAGPAGPAGAIPQSLTFITPSGLVYICTPPTPTVPTYTCTVQTAPPAPGPVVLPAIR